MLTQLVAKPRQCVIQNADRSQAPTGTRGKLNAARAFDDWEFTVVPR